MDDFIKRHGAFIERIRQLLGRNSGEDHHEAVALGQTILHETVGDRHPLMATFKSVVDKYDWGKAEGACKTLITLWKNGALVNPRFQIARELEEDVVDIAEKQWKDAEKEQDGRKKELRLAVAAFLCGAALEDALRRLCDKHGPTYEAGNTSLAKLQSALYSPSNGVEFISKSENAQIGAWGQTRNNADHGNFSLLTSSEIQSMIVGTRGFIERHRP